MNDDKIISNPNLDDEDVNDRIGERKTTNILNPNLDDTVENPNLDDTSYPSKTNDKNHESHQGGDDNESSGVREPSEREKAVEGRRDHYGFIITSKTDDDGHVTNVPKPKELIKIELERNKKWLKMIRNWNFNMLSKYEKISRRTRKGVPDEMRGKVWTLFAHEDDIKRKYHHLLNTENIYSVNEKVMDEISRDIDRTFPRHELFIVKGGPGQVMLQKILQLYAAFDPEVGYCQGMAFIAATFLTYMPQESAFFCLFYVLQRPSYPLRKMYLPQMAMTQTVLYIFSHLAPMFTPRVWQHLEAQGVHHSMYCTSWFMTLFASSFPFEVVTRVFDIFLLEGHKIIYRVALAILKVNEAGILAADFEQIMYLFRSIPSTIGDVDKFFQVVFEIPLHTQHIVTLQDQYDAELRLHISKTRY